MTPAGSSWSSTPCDPLSRVPSGGLATSSRLASARPETMATRVSSATASRSIAARERSVARASSGRSTSGASVPSKSSATSRRSVLARVEIAACSGSETPGAMMPGARERLEERRRPVGHVVLAHAPAQGAHAPGALALRHLDRLGDRVLQSLDVVRVHEHRLPQLVGCPGELAEQQHAVGVEPARHVLLGDEVHAVAERGHEHDVGGQVEGDHLLARVSVVQVRDGLVPEGGVVAVQPAHGELDLVAQLPVGLDAFAGGARDLHEGDVLDLEPPVAEELAERLQAVADALRVVEAVDAEHDRLGVAEALPDLPRAGLDVGPSGDLLEAGGIDRDREVAGDDASGLAVAGGRVDDGAVRLVAEQAAHRTREVPGIRCPLEADHVGAEESVDDLAPPRQLRVDAVGGEGDVVEEPDHEVGAGLAQHPRHQLQLVVLHPDHRAVGCRARGRLGEAAVDAHVRVPPLAVERRRRDHVVVERPERVVRESLVVLLELVGRERHRDDRDAVVLEGVELAVGDAGPADPGAVGGTHDGFEGRDQSAGRALPLRLAVGALLVVDREPVRDDDHVVHVVDVEFVAFRFRGVHGDGCPSLALRSG